MRIIAGIFKGFKLQSFSGKNIRPTPSRIREAVFDIVGNQVVGVDFLDLFSGTGAVGIEAMSRGAKRVTFVDIDQKATNIIKNNLIKVKHSSCETNIIRRDFVQAIKLLNLKNNTFDIIFLDPPYNSNYFLKTLQLIDQNPICKEGGIIIVQHPINTNIGSEFKNLLLIKERKYGSSKISIYIKNN